MPMSSGIRFIDRERRRIEANIGGLNVEFPLNAIPDGVYEEMASALDSARNGRERLDVLYRSTLMKPTVATSNPAGIFPVNTAKKVVRLTLTDEAIEEMIDKLEGTELSWQGRPFDETLDERIELYQKTLMDDSKIDRFRLGAIEIFGDQTYQNIMQDPRVSLNLWHQDKNGLDLSYQMNCIAEIAPPGDPFFKYMRLMRRLFSSKFLDLRRSPDYICAYKFWVCETKDKSLAEKTGFVPI